MGDSPAAAPNRLVIYFLRNSPVSICRRNHVSSQLWGGRVLHHSRFSRETKPMISSYVLWELAHLIMEAKKSHHLLSASWRPRKADSVIQSRSEGLRIRGADGISLSPSPKAQEAGVLLSEGRRRWMPQLRPREQTGSSSTFSFCSGLSTLGDAHLHG